MECKGNIEYRRAYGSVLIFRGPSTCTFAKAHCSKNITEYHFSHTKWYTNFLLQPFQKLNEVLNCVTTRLLHLSLAHLHKCRSLCLNMQGHNACTFLCKQCNMANHTRNQALAPNLSVGTTDENHTKYYRSFETVKREYLQRERYIYSTTTFTAQDKTLPLYTHANHSSYVAFTPPKAAQAENL